MEKLLQQLVRSVNKLADVQARIESDIARIKNDISDMKGQLDENIQIIKTIIHRADELDAKYDCLLHTIATEESIATINAKCDLLNHRLFQQEARLRVLDKGRY